MGHNNMLATTPETTDATMYALAILSFSILDMMGFIILYMLSFIAPSMPYPMTVGPWPPRIAPGTYVLKMESVALLMPLLNWASVRGNTQ